MEQQLIKDLGRLGLVEDREPETLPPNCWTEMNNVRCEDGSIVAFLGHLELATLSVIPETMTRIFGFGDDVVAYAGSNAIYSWDGVVSTQYTGVTLSGNGTWDSIEFGGVGVFNNGKQGPVYISSIAGQIVIGPTQPAYTVLPYDNTENQNCTWDDVQMTCKFMRGFKSHLFAFDIDDCDGRNRHRVWWSHPSEAGEVPITWNPTLPEYDAGFVDLRDTSDELVDALVLRDTLQIYKEDSVVSCTYTGRADNLIFNFRLVTRSIGCYARHCVCDIGGKHFLVSDSDIYIYDGNSFKSIADERIKDSFFSSVDRTNFQNTFVQFYETRREVWLCYPNAGSTYCDKALIYNIQDDCWYRRDLPNVLCAIDLTTQLNAGDTTYGDWTTAGTTYGDLTTAGTTYGDLITQATVSESLILGSSDSKIYQMDIGNTANGSSITRYARRESIDFGDKADWHMVLKLYPHADGGAFRVRVGSQDLIDEAITWSDYQTFTPGTDYQMDFRVTGRMHCTEFSSIDDVYWKVSAYELNYTPVGRR